MTAAVGAQPPRPEGAASRGRLLERDAELAQIHAFVADTAAGGGGAVVVEGPPGIGKSELIAAAVELARERGLRVLAGAGGEFEREFAFGLVRHLFDPTVRSLPTQERDAVFAGAAGLAAPLLGVTSAAPAPTGDVFPMLHGLYWLAAGLANVSPLLIAVDDAHWADEPSLRWLHYLIRRLDGVPVLLVLSSRSTQPEARAPLLTAILHETGVKVIRPQPLSEPAAQLVLGEFFAEQPEPLFSHACHEASGGNPFLLRELSRSLAAAGGRPLDSEMGAVATARPEAISNQVLVRLDRLSDAARHLATSVAVLGGAVAPWQAAKLAELEETAASDAADVLVAAGLLAQGSPLRFVHAIVRTAVYDGLGVAHRAHLHRRAAVVLIDAGEEAERVAAQLLLSEPASDLESVEYLRLAAKTALARGSPAAASVYLRRAIAEPPPRDDRPRVLLELAEAEAAAADPNAGTRLPEAFAAATDPDMRARAFEHAAPFLLASGRTSETLEMLDTVRGEVSAADPGRELELEAQFIGAAMLDPRAVGLAAERLTRIGEDLSGGSRGERMVLCYLAYHRMWRSQDAARAVQLARRALADGRLLSERGVQPAELTGPIMALACADELDGAGALIDDAQEIALTQGSEHLFAFLACMRAIVAYRRGALADAEAEAQTCVEITVRSGLLLGAAVGGGWLIWTLVERGDLEAAEAVLQTVCPTGEVAPHAPFAILLAARGRLRVAAGRIEEGLADLLESGRRNQSFGIRNPVFVPWRAEAARAYRLLGRLDDACAVADEELAAASAWGTPGAIGTAHCVCALASGAEDDAIAELRLAGTLLRESPARLELARTLLALGSALRRDNLRAQAREPLREALDLATRCGASVLAAQAEAELRAAGARPRRAALTGVESLTSTETRIAELAAGGMSNPEIAQNLFVSRRTVETHLAHIYTKLNIGGRHQLGAALGVR